MGLTSDDGYCPNCGSWGNVHDAEMHPELGMNESTVIAKAIASRGIDPNDPPRKLTDEERERLADEIEMDML